MISVVIQASEDATALARLLTSLVPAAADGLVRDVVVLGAKGASFEIAEDAGAVSIPDGDGAQAIGRTKGVWIAHLPLAAVPAEGWMEIIAAHLALEPPSAARLTSGKRLFGLAEGPVGWLAPRRQTLSAAAVEQDLQRLARRLGGRRLRILRPV
jgi:hypothetical protein